MEKSSDEILKDALKSSNSVIKQLAITFFDREQDFAEFKKETIDTIKLLSTRGAFLNDEIEMMLNDILIDETLVYTTNSVQTICIHKDILLTVSIENVKARNKYLTLKIQNLFDKFWICINFGIHMFNSSNNIDLNDNLVEILEQIYTKMTIEFNKCNESKLGKFLLV